MGIGETQFWGMNPALLKPYLRADDIKKERENYLAWLQGLYNLEALQVALSGFGGKKSKKVMYPQQPFPITTSKQLEAERKKEERMKRQFETFVQGLKERNNG